MRCMLVIFMGSMLVAPALAAPLTQSARSHGYAFAQSQLTYTLDAFAAGEVRNFYAWGSITTTTAGNLTVSHIGSGKVMKAKSRLELN